MHLPHKRYRKPLLSPRAAGTGTIAGVWLNISISVIPDNTSLAHQARFFQLLTSSFWDAAIAWYVP